MQREALTRMCLRVFSDRPCEVLAAADGAEALKVADASPPDIVLMDIKMPTLDGLKSARRLLARQGHPPEIIFVTAYDEFAYAREALAIGAAEYVLKPVSPEELRRVLTSAADRVEAARRAAERAKRTAERLKAAMPLLRLQTFRDLLDGNLVCPASQAAALRERLSLAGVWGQPCLAMFFALGRGDGLGAPEEAVAEQDVTASFGRVMRRRSGASWLAGSAGPGRPGLLIEPPAGHKKTDVRLWAIDLAADLKSEAERLTGQAVSAGVGDAHPEKGGLAVSVREALEALRHALRLGAGALVHVTDIHLRDDASHPAPVLPPTGPLLDRVRMGQTSEAVSLATEIGEELALAARRDAKPETAALLAAELVALCGRAALEGGADPEEVRSLQVRVFEGLAGAATTGTSGVRTPPGSLPGVLVGFVRDMAALARSAQTERRHGVVRRALAYIQGNFDKPLTLEGVARVAHVSPYYLSHLLTRESGKSFTEHLTGARTKRAKDLLATTDLTVGEIAVRVGFSDGNYFARVFKRETGLTPSDYRRRVRERETGPGSGRPPVPGGQPGGRPS